MENWKRRIGKKIQERRIEMGFRTQAALAKELKIDTARVSNWETGEHIPAKHKADLFRILKIDEEYLRSETQESTEKPPTRSETIASIVLGLSSLNDEELGAVLALVSAAATNARSRGSGSL